MNQPPTWAGRSVPDPGGQPEPEKKKKAGLMPLAGVAGVALILGAGFFLGQTFSNNDDDATSETAAVPTTAVPTTAAPSTTAAPTTAAPTPDADESEPGDAAEDDAAAGADAAAEGDEDAGDAADDNDAAEGAAGDEAAGEDANQAGEDAAQLPADVPIRVSYLKSGVLTLTGAVPDADFGDEIARRAAVILGEENVINEYVIDERAPGEGVGGSVVVQDTVLFATNSSQIADDFVPILELGTSLMTTFETVTIEIVTHTDAQGSDTRNLTLSQERGTAIRDYWVGRGIDAGRLTIDARGESDPIATNETPEGRQLNRRGEFIISGLLG